MKGRGLNKLAEALPVILCLLCALSVLPSCDMVVPPEGETVLDNPRDPGNPSTYEAPLTTITVGPSEGSTVNTSSVTFTYESNADLFQTRVNGSDWSEWSASTSTILEYLDEGSFTFEVRSAYDPGQGEPTDIEETPKSVYFTVDAVAGPSLRLSPLLIETAQGVDFELELIAEEVTDLMAVKAVINYNPDQIMVVEIQEGSFLASTGGSLASYFTSDPASGTIEINIGTAAGLPSGVSDTGVVAIIKLRGLTAAESDLIFNQDSTELRDSNNQTISISSLVGARVRMQ